MQCSLRDFRQASPPLARAAAPGRPRTPPTPVLTARPVTFIVDGRHAS